MSTAALAARCGCVFLALSSGLAFCEAPVDPTFAFGAPYPIPFGSDDAVVAAIARDSTGHLFTANTIFSDTTVNKQAVTRHIGPVLPSLVVFPRAYEGLIDQEFANNGVATDFFGAGSNEAYAIAVDHQDRIIVGGSATAITTCGDGSSRTITAYTLVRLQNSGGSSDGQGDWNFGNLGEAIYGDCDHYAYGLAGLVVDQDDSIIAIGATRQGSLEIATLIRWTSDGKIDATFGSNGVQTVDYGTNDSNGTAITLDGTGRIIAAFDTIVGGQKVGVVGRYESNGSLDTTFGDHGFVQISEVNDYGNLCCVAVDNRGRVIAGGTVTTGYMAEPYHADAFVMRFREDGLADETFGLHGLSHPSGSPISYAWGLAVDQRNRPLVIGSAQMDYSPYLDAALFHLNLDGSPNRSVGFDGTYTTELGFSDTNGLSLLIDPLGRPTAALVARDSDDRNVPALVRYDELFGDGFD